jgi:aminopeptidase-like protein
MNSRNIKLNNFEIPNLGNEIYRLAEELFPINRSLTGNGVRHTFGIIKKHLPNLKIKEIQSGTKVYDWTVPEEWNVTDAYIESGGKRIIDFKKNNLHLVSYSVPINQIMGFNDLKKHLYVNKEMPEVIPYTVSFYKKTWGFCLSYKKYKKISLLKNKKFKVVINSTLNKKGSMTYAD